MKRIIAITTIFVMVLTVGGIIVKPRNIISSTEGDTVLILAEHNNGYSSGNANFVDISDSIKILTLLEKYREQISLDIAQGYSLNNVEFRIILKYSDGVKEILLGNENYSYTGVGKFKYAIINADGLKNELRELVE